MIDEPGAAAKTSTRQGVVAVLVAFNRRDLLREALEAVLAQTEPVAAVVVVDNASSDGSADMVATDFPSVDLVRLATNTGGSGGFAVGIAAGLDRYEPEWAWLMDDDTIPTPTALAELRGAAERYPGRVAIAGSRAIWVDGTDHPMNTPRARAFASRTARAKAAAVGAVQVRSSSFVSMLVRAGDVRCAGLPVADYFIWNDDFEFSTRLLRRSTGIFVPASVVVHKTLRRGATDDDPGPRFYYEVRNKIWMFRLSQGLGPVEKILYGGSSVVRWVRTLRRSSARPVLRDGFRRGLRDGLRSSPRSLADALAGSGDGARVVNGWRDSAL